MTETQIFASLAPPVVIGVAALVIVVRNDRSARRVIEKFKRDRAA